METHYYTEDERRTQLKDLAKALRQLIPAVRNSERFSHRAEDYARPLAKAERLLADGFTQEDLSDLARDVPDLFDRHPRWDPPLEEVSPGKWVEPEWFTSMDAILAPALRAAELLRTVGHYLPAACRPEPSPLPSPGEKRRAKRSGVLLWVIATLALAIAALVAAAVMANIGIDLRLPA